MQPETQRSFPAPWGPDVLERMVRAVEVVRERLERAAAVLEGAGLPYAVVDGNAVTVWVARVDQAAVRNTQDVDLLVRRSDLDAITTALAGAGFVRRRIKSVEMFLDGPGARARDAIHVVFAGEKVRPDDPLPAPDVTESEPAGTFRVLTLPALVRMKLTSFRLKDQVHLLDMLDVGLLDVGWVATLPPVLGARLQGRIENLEA